MLASELLKKVKKIELKTRRVVDDLLAGQYRSQFKGYGVQFSDHRLYTPGDDVRHIDWKVSARSRDPVIKKYEEERELTVMLLVDVSGSQGFGTHRQWKFETAAETAGILAYAASRVGDRVGAILFSGGIDKIIPPKKGRSHILRVIRDVLAAEPREGSGTALSDALESALHLLKHLGIVFVVSDFESENIDKPLRRLARRHDVIAVPISDRRESEASPLGTVLFRDPETGREAWVNTDSYAFKTWIKKRGERKTESLSALFKSCGVEAIPLSSEKDAGDAILSFFRKRRRR